MSYVVTLYKKTLSETVHFKSELDNVSSPYDKIFETVWLETGGDFKILFLRIQLQRFFR